MRGKWKSIHSLAECYRNIGRKYQSMMTSQHLTEMNGLGLTLSREVFRAKTFHTPEKVQDCKESEADCFTKQCESFAKWDQDTLCWRTSQRCLFGGWTKFSGRWPRSGTMRNGNVYQRRPLVPHMEEIESLCWVATPTATMSVRSEEVRDSGRKPQPMEICKGKIPTYCRSEIPPDPAGEAIGNMNPQWGEWLMGFPTGWTDCEGSETQSSRRSRNGSDDV